MRAALHTLAAALLIAAMMAVIAIATHPTPTPTPGPGPETAQHEGWNVTIPRDFPEMGS